MENAQIATLDALITSLGDANDSTRWNARQSIIAHGESAVPPLISALGDPRIIVRWEATQILATLCDPTAAPALVKTLADDDAGVRWSAVKALIALKEHAIIPLLQGLVHSPRSNLMFEGAHHVLSTIPLSPELRKTITPVLVALGGAAPDLETPIVARNVLTELEK